MYNIRSLWLFFVFLYTTVTLTAQSEYHYSYLPKTLYANQIFSVTITGSDTHPHFTFDRSSPIKPLFDKPLEVVNGKDTFYTFYFKAGHVVMSLPRLFIHSDVGSSSLDEQVIGVKPLKGETHYSSVIASDMQIKGQQVSNYDDKNHMVTLLIEAYEANIEDMQLNNVTEYGIDEIHRKHAKVTAEFYVVIPREQQKLHFSYYNTIKKKFITLTTGVKVMNTSVTTQSDLNPQVDAFERLKKYALISFSLFFLLMFIWKRDFFYLILGMISLITLLTFYMPHKKTCIKQGALVYLLPTSTSTISTRINSKIKTILLGERKGYFKVEYQKGKIGWIKYEDLCKN